jgi:hypothetical protein
MKKCTYCGKEYGDEASICAIDGEPLAKFPPEPEPAGVNPHEEKIVTVEIFATRNAAEIAATKLEAHGIECLVKADDAGGMYPNLALAGGVRLQVRASDAERALGVIKTEAPLPETFESEAITENTSFDTPSPKIKLAFGQIIVSIVIGVLLTLFYQWAEKQGTKMFYHHAGNGQVDEEWIYQDGHLVEHREDRNLDGKWDYRVYYKQGLVVRAEYDDNFDGKPDAWWTYSDDGTDTLQLDTDFNGTPDEFDTYKKRIMQGIEIKPNGSKFAITKEIFSNGILTEIWRGGDSNGNFRTVEKYDAFFNPISTNQLQLQSPLK